MRVSLTYLFLFTVFYSTAQNTVTDSLEAVIAQQKNDIAEGRALNTLAMEYTRTDQAKAKNLLYDAIKLGNQLQHPRTLSAAYSQMVTIFQNTAKPDSAIYYLNALKRLADTDTGTDKDIVKGNYFSAAGLFYKKSGDLKKALAFFKQSLILMEAVGNKVSAGGQALNIGNTYLNLSNYNQALHYYVKALKWFEETGNQKGIAFCYQNISECYTELKQFSEALKYVHKTIELKKVIGDKRGLGNAEQTLGRIYLGLKEYDKSMVHFTNAMKVARNMELAPEEQKIYFSIGKLYIEKNDLKEALHHLNQSKLLARQLRDTASYLAADMEISSLQKGTVEKEKFEKKAFESLHVFQQSGNLAKEAGSYKHLADFYTDKKDFEKALEFTNKYYALNDSVRSNEIQSQFKKIEEQYNSEKNEKQIALLKKDQEINRQQLKQQQFFLFASAIVTILALIGVWLIINRNRLRQRMKELELRNRIAADLHDEVGSSLSSIHLLSQMAKQHNFNMHDDILTKVSANAYETMEKMSDIVWMIKPTENEGIGIKERMQRFMYDLCSGRNIVCNFIADDLDKMKLTMSQKKNLYLIFKEAINNAVKYSGSNSLNVVVELRHKNLVMHIQDYGNGFDEKIIMKGNGLDNMQVRAKELKGSLLISSKLQQGTELNLSFPLS